MSEVFEAALAAVERGEEPTLMVVVDHRGSVPGTTGAMMLVSARGSAGTIGGGVVEKELVDRARVKAELHSAASPEWQKTYRALIVLRRPRSRPWRCR